MEILRKSLKYFAPPLIWTLMVAIGFAIVENFIQLAMFLCETRSLEKYYLQGLLLFFPFILLERAVKKTKKPWQYFLLSTVIITLSHLIVNSVLFTVICIMLCISRDFTRMNQQAQIKDGQIPKPSKLDEPTHIMIIPIFFYFFLCGFLNQPFLQKMSIYHFMGTMLLLFIYNALNRFEKYIVLSDGKAFVPKHHILQTGTKAIVASALLSVLFLAPILQTQYHFMPISFTSTEVEQTSDEEIKTEQVTKNYQSKTLREILGERQTKSPLSFLWQILDKVLWALLYISGLCVVVRFFYSIIKNLNKTLYENGDIVKKIDKQDDEAEKITDSENKFSMLFDFSETMKIRRRYKNELKKHNPKPWQTPSEMEKMANIDIPLLHKEYERARYKKV